MNSKNRQIIMDNYLNPINRMKKEEYYRINTNNSSCIDNINLYIKFNNEKISDITFDGEACAIAISSTSIMIKNIIGKSKKDALQYIQNFYQMLDNQKYDENILHDGVVYRDIANNNGRKICATLPLKGLEKAILENLE